MFEFVKFLIYKKTTIKEICLKCHCLTVIKGFVQFIFFGWNSSIFFFPYKVINAIKDQVILLNFQDSWTNCELNSMMMLFFI
jgi:hypothetical protein